MNIFYDRSLDDLKNAWLIRCTIEDLEALRKIGFDAEVPSTADAGSVSVRWYIVCCPTDAHEQKIRELKLQREIIKYRSMQVVSENVFSPSSNLKVPRE